MSGCLHALSEVVEQVRGLRGRFRPSGPELGGGWDELLRGELDKPYWSRLLDFVTREHENHEVYPPRARTFRAFELTPYDEVEVVILGQDPYTNPGQAHGLAFSVPR